MSSREVSHNPSGAALILGGGGSTGNAWLIGVIAGLFEAGLDVTDADVIVGTSAGSTAAVQVSSKVAPTELLAQILASAPAPTQSKAAPASSDGARVPSRPATNHMERTGAIIASAQDAADMRRTLGAAALAADTESPSAAHMQWRATVGARLPIHIWPQRRLLITAVDAQTGEPVVFDRHSGVDLVDAVAASCASGMAHRIGDSQYIDGGYRSNADNADLAAGYGRVLVLSPFGGRSRTPVEWGLHLSTQVDALQESGSSVETVFPEAGAEHMFGANAMNVSLRPAAARAGHDQGRALAAQLSGWWAC